MGKPAYRISLDDLSKQGDDVLVFRDGYVGCNKLLNNGSKSLAKAG